MIPSKTKIYLHGKYKNVFSGEMVTVTRIIGGMVEYRRHMGINVRTCAIYYKVTGMKVRAEMEKWG